MDRKGVPEDFEKLVNEFLWTKDMYLTAQKKHKGDINEALPYYVEARDLACIAFYYADKVICELHEEVRSTGASNDSLNYYTDFVKTEYANELVKIIEHCDEVMKDYFSEGEMKNLNDNELYKIFKLLSAPVYV